MSLLGSRLAYSDSLLELRGHISYTDIICEKKSVLLKISKLKSTFITGPKIANLRAPQIVYYRLWHTFIST